MRSAKLQCIGQSLQCTGENEECRVQRQGGEGGQVQDRDHGTGRNAGDDYDYDEICWKIGSGPCSAKHCRKQGST